MKKIMFNDRYGLTEAVLSGHKTMTRRIINPQPEVSERMGMIWKGYAYGITSPAGSPYFLKDVYHNFLSGTNFPQYRRFKVGEVIAIAQAYNDFYNDECDPRIFPDGAGWTNKMFVRADLMPHQIRITNVRVERLQDISDDDCIKEGVVKRDHIIPTPTQQIIPQYFPCQHMIDCVAKVGWGRVYDTPHEAFADLIEKVSGMGTWKSNPYVFAYEFELVK